MTESSGIEPLRNDRNGSVSHLIKQYFSKYPRSTATECCKALGLKHRQYGGRARKIKHDTLQWRQSIVPVTDRNGCPPKTLSQAQHRLICRFKDPVPATFVVALEQKACAGRAEGAWYRSPNRNGQLGYYDDHLSMQLHPKTGTCRIFPGHRMTYADLRAFVEDAFAKALPSRALLSLSFGCMINGLQVAQRHRTFPIGPVTPFKVDFYRETLGLDILADRSHPEHLETHENWPSWIPPLFEFERIHASVLEKNTKALADYTSQITRHLDVMEGIDSAAASLNETASGLKEAVGRLTSLLKNNLRCEL